MLKKFYDTLNEPDKKKFVRVITDTTGWALATFYYKLRHNNLSLLEKAAISKIIESWQTMEVECPRTTGTPSGDPAVIAYEVTFTGLKALIQLE